jgi:hypothetical protein
MRLVVIGTSPDHDTSIVVGPYIKEHTANRAATRLVKSGWNAEVVQLQTVSEVCAELRR